MNFCTACGGHQAGIVHLAGGQTPYFRIGLLRNLFLVRTHRLINR